jgi:hypothetical protein
MFRAFALEKKVVGALTEKKKIIARRPMIVP